VSSRPFSWAANTTLDPWDPQHDQVACQVDLADDEDHEAYEALTMWLKHHQNTSGAIAYVEGEGAETLEDLAQ